MDNFIAKIDEPVIVVKVNQTYKPGMSAGELYDCTRGIWKVQINSAEQAQYAFAVYSGKVLEVYKIDEWHRELTTEYKFIKPKPDENTIRYEFTGRVAADEIRKKYVGKNLKVGAYTIKYFNVERKTAP